MLDKTDEINAIFDLQIDTNQQIKLLKEKYKKELENFTYVKKITDIYEKQKIYIRYIGINGKLYWGGFLYKIDKINNKYFIVLINKNKKPWTINFDTNYVFYNSIITTRNESLRNVFIKFLDTYTK